MPWNILIPVACILVVAAGVVLLYRREPTAPRSHEGAVASAARTTVRAWHSAASIGRWVARRGEKAPRSYADLRATYLRRRRTDGPADPVAPRHEPARELPGDRTLPGELPPAAGPVLGGGIALTPAAAAAVTEIAVFEAEDDGDLIRWMQHAAAFQLAQADAWRDALETCLNGIGLDPASVRGMAEFADAQADSAHTAAGMVAQFTTVYQAVMEFAAAGGILPRDGRWLTGEGT